MKRKTDQEQVGWNTAWDMINTKSKICQIIIDNIFPTKHTFETLRYGIQRPQNLYKYFHRIGTVNFKKIFLLQKFKMVSFLILLLKWKHLILKVGQIWPKALIQTFSTS